MDQQELNGKFLILGSASKVLIKQSSESLAGRISYHEIGPLILQEILPDIAWHKHWMNGGYPKSILHDDNEESFEWRLNYIRIFRQRDLSQIGFFVSSTIIERFWKMLAHCHGQIINYSSLGNSLGGITPYY